MNQYQMQLQQLMSQLNNLNVQVQQLANGYVSPNPMSGPMHGSKSFAYQAPPNHGFSAGWQKSGLNPYNRHCSPHPDTFTLSLEKAEYESVTWGGKNVSHSDLSVCMFLVKGFTTGVEGIKDFLHFTPVAKAPDNELVELLAVKIPGLSNDDSVNSIVHKLIEANNENIFNVVIRAEGGVKELYAIKGSNEHLLSSKPYDVEELILKHKDLITAFVTTHSTPVESSEGK